jgi:hypothetical protein
MSKVECTAVNELVDLVRTKSLDSDSADEDLFASASPRAHRLRGTPAPAWFEMPAPPAPVPQPEVAAQVVALPAIASTPAPRHLRPSARRSPSHVDRYIPLGTLARRFALPLTGLVGFGIIAGIAYTRMSHHANAATPAPTPAEIALAAAAAVPPPPAPVIAAPPAAAPGPQLVDVRLDSTPAGATATLLSNGTSTLLGSTPVDTSVDPSKSYDVVFALAGHPSRVEHLNPNATQHVAVAFDDVPPEPTVADKPAKPARHRGRHAPQAARVAAAAPVHHAAAPKAAKAAGVPDPGVGNGTLAIATSGPAAILIDDSNTGLTAPQRAIPLPAGHHNVRIIAAAQHINKLFPVDISAHHTTRLNPF